MTNSAVRTETAPQHLKPSEQMNMDSKHKEDDDSDKPQCSAISTLERGMPTCDINELTEQLKALMLADAHSEPQLYNEHDIERVRTDPWATQRYLIRCRLNIKSAHRMMKAALLFKNTPPMDQRQFPREFHQVGAVFCYEKDRKENVVVYLRVKVNQKIPVVTQYLKAFLFRQIELADVEAKGKGIVICFDLQGAGIGNVDMDFVYFVFTAMVSYFPKGVSYILVHELPWYLRSVWTLARQWLSDDHKQLIKFSNSQTIYEYINKENLPDFMGGTCKRDYKAVPKDAISLKQASINWNIPMEELDDIRKKYVKYLPEEEQK